MNKFILFAVRVIRKNKFYTFLNVLGLSLGLTVCIITGLYIKNELTYDQQYTDYERIYRIQSQFAIGDKEDKFDASQWGIAPMLQLEMPEVETFTRVSRIGGGKPLLVVEDKKFYEDRVLMVDSTFFELFNTSFLVGDAKNCLNAPNSIVLTKSMSIKYFGGLDVALGKIVSTPQRDYIVTAIVEDNPDNTSMRYNVLISNNSFPGLPRKQEELIESLWQVSDLTYVKLAKGSSPETILQKFPAFYDKYMAEVGKLYNATYQPYFARLEDLHLQQGWGSHLSSGGNIYYIYAFFTVGALILLLACINYVNLVTSRSAARAKEIGMKKVMGASRSELIVQFLGESILLTLFSLLIALSFTELIFKFTPLNEYLNKQLALNVLAEPIEAIFIVLLVAFTGILGGLYPALYLSSLNPVSSLKGIFKLNKSSLFFRKALVTLQLLISVTVALLALYINQQIDFARSKDLGYNKDNIMLVNVPDTIVSRSMPALIEEMKTEGIIENASVSNTIFGRSKGRLLFKIQDSKDQIVDQVFDVIFAGYDFIETMGLQLQLGRSFDKNIVTDRHFSILVNEKLVEEMHWENAIGKLATNDNFENLNPDSLLHVIGVIKDFHQSSLHDAIVPTIVILTNDNSQEGMAHIRIKGGNVEETVTQIKEKWARVDPNRPFNFEFLDDVFNEQYKEDEKQSFLLNVLTFICIIISLLGVIGLASYSTEQRTKEIAIRKVLGSENSQIIFLIFREIALLLGIASVLAIPFALVAFNKWLENFAYKIEPGVVPIMIVIAIAFLLNFVTVAYHALKAANSNPIYALKYE